jgi:hypothetical protein
MYYEVYKMQASESLEVKPANPLKHWIRDFEYPTENPGFEL